MGPNGEIEFRQFILTMIKLNGRSVLIVIHIRYMIYLLLCPLMISTFSCGCAYYGKSAYCEKKCLFEEVEDLAS